MRAHWPAAWGFQPRPGRKWIVVESGVSRTTFVTTPRSWRAEASGLTRLMMSSGASGVVRSDATRRRALIWVILLWSSWEGVRILGWRVLFEAGNCCETTIVRRPKW